MIYTIEVDRDFDTETLAKFEHDLVEFVALHLDRYGLVGRQEPLRPEAPATTPAEEARRLGAPPIPLNRAEADAVAICLGKATNGYQEDLLDGILRKAVVPEGKANRRSPSAYDRWAAQSRKAAARRMLDDAEAG